jgi:Protein of unknown function (DUF3467)
MTDQQKSDIQIDLAEPIAQGQYSNLAISNFSQEEFILDYLFLQPQVARAKVNSRIIMSPRNVKKLAQLLTAQVADYEKKYGVIQEEVQNRVQLNFN